MLETVAIILIVLWLLGIVSGYTMGNFIYVLLVIAICHLFVPAPCSTIDTVIESPGATARGTCMDAAGSISIHAWYSFWRPVPVDAAGGDAANPSFNGGECAEKL